MNNQALAERIVSMLPLGSSDPDARMAAVRQIHDLLQLERPESFYLPQEVEEEELAKIVAEIAERNDMISYASRRIYNADFGFHKVMSESLGYRGVIQAIDDLCKVGKAAKR